MQERHHNRKLYFDEQAITTKKFVIPYIEEVLKIDASTRILEIGCGEAGNLVPFLEIGCEAIGVDLSESQIERGRTYLKETVPNGKVELIYQDIYNVTSDDIGKFDLIFMRDVIEHIHNQEKFMLFLQNFLTENGKVFFGFPPWCMPFGGHQQISAIKALNKLPFFHLLPNVLYRGLFRVFKERESTIDALLEIKETGLSINRFEGIVKRNNYHTDKKTLYFINPNYETKFGLTPRVLSPIITAIPFVRDFFTTCYYCVLSKK